MSRKKKFRAGRLLILGGMIGTGLLVWGFVRKSGQNEISPNSFYTVKRGDLLISVVEEGALRAVNEVIIRNSLEGISRILSLAPEGSHVKKGDLLVELDCSDLKDRLNDQEVMYQDNLFLLLQAQENLKIQKSLIESRIKDAELQVELTQSDLEKYRDGDAPKQIRTAEAKIGLLEEGQRMAQERYTRTVELHKGGNSTKSELEADALSLKRQQLDLRQSQEDLRLSKKFDQPNTVRILEAGVQQAKDELERLKHRSAAEIAQAEADLKTSQKALDIMESALKEQRKQLASAKIFAPQDGLVVYASASPYGWRDGRSDDGRARVRENGYGFMFDSDGRFRRDRRGGRSRDGGYGSSDSGRSGSSYSSSGSSSSSSSSGPSAASGSVAASASSATSGSTSSPAQSPSLGAGIPNSSGGGLGGSANTGRQSSPINSSASISGLSPSASGDSSASGAARPNSFLSSFNSSVAGSSLGSSGSGSSSSGSGSILYSSSEVSPSSFRSSSQSSSSYDSGYYYTGSTMIEEGGMVRQRQELIKLPDVSRMMAEVKIPEARVRQILPGMIAYVKVETLPGRRFKGSVRKVGILPDAQASWINPNTKVYATEILIGDQLPELKPGVSARTEIIITNLPRVLSVPIQAVTTYKGQQVCFVAKGNAASPVPVETGLFNDQFIEIESGLKEGDRVLLAPVGDPEKLESENAESATNEVGSVESGALKKQNETGADSPGSNLGSKISHKGGPSNSHLPKGTGIKGDLRDRLKRKNIVDPRNPNLPAQKERQVP